MPDIINYPLFLLTAITLNLYPGPDTLYILGRSVAQGCGAGVVSALGIGTGALVHTLLGAVGLTALVATSATAYQVVKLLGAAYLVYLGVGMMFGRREVADSSLPAVRSLGRIYAQGVLTNVLNPKVALFFLALIPQFIAPGSVHPGAAFAVLGLTFVLTGTCWCLIVALVAGRLHRGISRRGGLACWLGRVGGGVLAGLGLRLALTD